MKETADKRLTPYKGHDTVGIVSLDLNDSMACGTSTSGLFMKKRGRLGDSPLVGSGFYVDGGIYGRYGIIKSGNQGQAHWYISYADACGRSNDVDWTVKGYYKWNVIGS